jgi:hypothetical protein
MKNLKTSRKGYKRNTKRAKEGTLKNPYKKAMRIKGRTFVETKDGDIREMDENGKLIPDHLVKPL